MSIELKEAAEKALFVLGSATSFMSRKARDQHESVVAELRTAIQQAESEPVEPVVDVRCEGCGYMTHHREHMGCVRAAKQHTHPAPDAAIDSAIYNQCPDFDDWHEGPSIDDIRAIVRAAILALQAHTQVQSEPVGYMNAGNIHELKQGELPYGYVYPQKESGVSIPVYDHPAQGVPDDVARDAISTVREQYRGTDLGKAAECICDAIDAAMLASSPAQKGGA